MLYSHLLSFFSFCTCFLPTPLEPPHSRNGELEETTAGYSHRSGEQDYITDCMMCPRYLPDAFLKIPFTEELYASEKLVPVLHHICNQTIFPKIYPKFKW